MPKIDDERKVTMKNFMRYVGRAAVAFSVVGIGVLSFLAIADLSFPDPAFQPLLIFGVASVFLAAACYILYWIFAVYRAFKTEGRLSGGLTLLLGIGGIVLFGAAKDRTPLLFAIIAFIVICFILWKIHRKKDGEGDE